jgi:hypothetical protein
MVGYTALNIIGKGHHRRYYDVKRNIKKFKKINDEINGVNQSIFK